MISSSSPATVAVEKATSYLLIVPDWTLNIDICDSINSHHWQAKDVIKALKKRLQHKSPKVQLLAVTLLETLVNNCGDHVHLHIADRNILGEMVKIVRKKADMQVRNKILILLHSWQEAFGGQNGKHTQYYWAYEELRRSGVQFPQVSSDASPIFTPPAANPTLRHVHAGLGLPSNSSKTLDETMATKVESLSLSGLDSMRNVMELLTDMLQAVNPSDQAAVKDEVIIDLVDRCRSNQKKLMQMLTATGDEELLARGLELNDSLQIELARHDAIVSGSALPIHRNSSFRLAEASTSKSSEVSSPRKAEASISSKPTDVKKSSTMVNFSSQASVSLRKAQINKGEEEEDDFAQLARRHSQTQTTSQTQSPSAGLSEGTNSTDATYALAPTNPPEPVKTSKEQDMIDLLSLALVPTSTSPQPQYSSTPHSSPHDMYQVPTMTQGNPYGSQNYPGNQVQVSYNNYVVPWAQRQPTPQPKNQQQMQSQVQVQYQLIPQLQYQFQDPPQSHPYIQPQSQSQPQFQTQFPTNCHPQFQKLSQIHLQPDPRSQPHLLAQSQLQYLAQTQPQYQSLYQPQFHPLLQAQIQPQAEGDQHVLQPAYSHYSSGYCPPSWAATPGYYSGQSHISAGNVMVSTPQNSYPPPNLLVQASRPLQHFNSLSLAGTNGSFTMGDSQVSPGPRTATPTAAWRPFIPSYKLFEDLNVLGSANGMLKTTSSPSSSMSGVLHQGMVGGSVTDQGLGKF